MQQHKACLTCLHIQKDDAGKYVCRLFTDKFDLVQGTYPHLSAYAARNHKDKCGPEGRRHEAVPEAVQQEVDAIIASHGPSVGLRVRDLGLRVMMAPAYAIGATVDASRNRWRAGKQGLANFGARVAAARAAFRGIQDNTQEPVVLIAAKPDPIEEAKAIEAGAPAVVNAELVAELRPEVLKPGSDPEPATGKPEPAPAVAAEPEAIEQVRPVPLAVPTDPKFEAKVAATAAAVVAVLLLGYVAAGLLHNVQWPRGTLSGLVTGKVTCCERGNPSRCYPCEKARTATCGTMAGPMTMAPRVDRARCCYRMPDGSTRCYDCSTRL